MENKQPGGERSVEKRGLNLQATPNPATGEVRLTWESATTTGDAVLVVQDVLGGEVAVLRVQAVERSIQWKTAGMPAGRYIATITIGGQRVSIQLHLSR